MSMSYYSTPGLSEFGYFYSRWLKSSELLERLERGIRTRENVGFKPYEVLMSTIDPNAPGPNLLEPYSQQFLSEYCWKRFRGLPEGVERDEFLVAVSKEWQAWHKFTDTVSSVYPELKDIADEAMELYGALNTGAIRCVLDGYPDDPLALAKVAEPLIDFLIQVCKAEINRG